MKKLITTAVLALIGVALIGTKASAVTAGDLILGFVVTDGTGQGNAINLEVDLGAASSFTSSVSFNLNVGGNAPIGSTGGLSVSDISGTYGAGWASRTDLAWGLAGTVDTAPLNKTQVSSNVALFSGSAVQSYSNTINNLYPGFSAGTASTNSTSAITLSTGNAQSYYSLLTSNGTNAVGQSDFGTGLALEQSVTSGSSFNLYQVQKTGSSNVLLGSFSLGSNGSLSFTGSAVPEPSTYALIALGAGVMLLMRRRSFNS